MISILIPAHNESLIIERTVASLLHQVSDGDEIIIVTNGCADNTADIARKFEPRVIVIDSPIPSKTNALNLGDAQASLLPRLYMDADIQLTDGSLAKIVDALSSGNMLAVSPDPKMDLSNSSWAVKAYYDIWLSLPYCQHGMMGSGAYALSEEGRKRFDTFPDLIADDGYVRALFNESERGKVAGAYAIVKAPANLHWLLKIKSRSRLGQMELAQKHPELLKNEQKAYASALPNMLKSPLKWPAVAVYLYVNIMSRLQARRMLPNLSSYQWEKDMSSRK